jgi:hypothetical protein
MAHVTVKNAKNIHVKEAIRVQNGRLASQKSKARFRET